MAGGGYRLLIRGEICLDFSESFPSRSRPTFSCKRFLLDFVEKKLESPGCKDPTTPWSTCDAHGSYM